MRLWHQSLLPYLDNQRLLGQHRECCALRGKGWGRKHKTVDYVFTHSPAYLVAYHFNVIDEMQNRGYEVDNSWNSVLWRGGELLFDLQFADINEVYALVHKEPILPEHTPEYLSECIDLLKAKGAKCDWEGINKLIKESEQMNKTQNEKANIPKEKLRIYRLQNGYSQREFCKILGYGEAQYVKIELGKVKPTPRFVARLMLVGLSYEEAKELVEC